MWDLQFHYRMSVFSGWARHELQHLAGFIYRNANIPAITSITSPRVATLMKHRIYLFLYTLRTFYDPVHPHSNQRARAAPASSRVLNMRPSKRVILRPVIVSSVNAGCAQKVAHNHARGRGSRSDGPISMSTGGPHLWL